VICLKFWRTRSGCGSSVSKGISYVHTGGKNMDNMFFSFIHKQCVVLYTFNLEFFTFLEGIRAMSPHATFVGKVISRDGSFFALPNERLI
jgi:hypothetical protein